MFTQLPRNTILLISKSAGIRLIPVYPCLLRRIRYIRKRWSLEQSVGAYLGTGSQWRRGVNPFWCVCVGGVLGFWPGVWGVKFSQGLYDFLMERKREKELNDKFKGKMRVFSWFCLERGSGGTTKTHVYLVQNNGILSLQ